MHKCPHKNVLNVETEPRMREGDNRTNGKFASVFLSAERSPHINVLNIEMEPRMGDREN